MKTIPNHMTTYNVEHYNPYMYYLVECAVCADKMIMHLFITNNKNRTVRVPIVNGTILISSENTYVCSKTCLLTCGK